MNQSRYPVGVNMYLEEEQRGFFGILYPNTTANPAYDLGDPDEP